MTQTVLDPPPAIAPAVALPTLPTLPGPPSLHHDDLPTPSSTLLTRPRLLAGMVLTFLTLGVLAMVANGVVLRLWDEPITHAVSSFRNVVLDQVFLTFSRLGSTVVVLSVGVVCAAVAYRRCHAVAAAFLFATVSRPLVEFAIKALVDRDRPDFDQMVTGQGPSFPSGHAFVSVALWGLLPLLVALYTQRRWLWQLSVAVSVVLVTGIALSRVYLGVHWFSDVVGGVILGVLWLLVVEQVLNRVHHRSEDCGEAAITSSP